MSGVSLPVFVFGRGIVEVFGGADESGEEDSVSGAWHACQIKNDSRESVNRSIERERGGR